MPYSKPSPYLSCRTACEGYQTITPTGYRIKNTPSPKESSSGKQQAASKDFATPRQRPIGAPPPEKSLNRSERWSENPTSTPKRPHKTPRLSIWDNVPNQ